MIKLVKLMVILAALWFAGLLAFIANVPSERRSATNYESLKGTDQPKNGIVVYTGGRGTRISKAMTLFKDGGGQRLLISGVHPDITHEHLQDLWDGDNSQFDCCVDLGLRAQTTKGNAIELFDWALSNDMTRILLVTSDYHMPRALAETKAVAHQRVLNDKIKIIPYSAPSDYIKVGGLPNNLRAWKKVAVEYSKFLMARTQLFTSRILS